MLPHTTRPNYESPAQQLPQKEPHPKEFAALAAAMNDALKECQKADTTGLFAHLDALSIARDTEAIRKALGEERLSFMASGIGGSAAAAYARLFPQRIRAMYLDGVNNQSEGWPAQRLLGLPVMQRMFPRFAEWCAETLAYALHDQDAEAVWRRLLRDADRHPIPVTSSQYGKGKLTGWLLTSTLPLDPGPENADWVAFAAAVEKARRGDGSGFADQALFNARFAATPGALVMSCGDDRGYTSYAQLEDFRRQARKIAPEYAGAAIDALGCTGWPLPVANPSRPLPTRGLPPFLGVGTTWVRLHLDQELHQHDPGIGDRRLRRARSHYVPVRQEVPDPARHQVPDRHDTPRTGHSLP